MNLCPCCGNETNVIRVTGETVQDLFEVWMADGRPVRVVCIETEERNHAILSTGKHSQPQTAQVCARHSAVPALPEDVSAKTGQGTRSQAKVPVLQKAARKPTGKIEHKF